MKISGFTMVRNADKFYFPIKESIESVLPLVDEFIVALGDNDEDDKTRAFIESIKSDKIKIFDRVWSKEEFLNCEIFAKETNFALSQCTGDWCFYIQADEAIHEEDFPAIKEACEDNLNRTEVDGLLFKYNHFWGDYDHYLPVHGWYKNEIRIVRNNRNVYSTKDAQSFRKEDNKKLKVVEIDARIYHYGWVRPPHMMQAKKKEHDSMQHGADKIEKTYSLLPNEYDYGPLGNVPVFNGTHPAVMKEFISKLNWKQKLNYSKKGTPNRAKTKHEKFKYKLLTKLENIFNGGRDFVGYTNWEKLK